VSAAAAFLGLSAKQVRRLADQGQLNDHRSDMSAWRSFDVDELHAYRVHLAEQNVL
jgi:hypothetical protein